MSLNKEEFHKQVLQKLEEWEYCKYKFQALSDRADANLKTDKSYLDPIWLINFGLFKFVKFGQRKIIAEKLSRAENIRYLEKSYELLKDHDVRELFSFYENADVFGENWDNHKFSEQVTEKVFEGRVAEEYGLANDPELLGTICHLFLESKKEALKGH